MRMLRSGNDDCVQVVEGEQFFKIFECTRRFAVEGGVCRLSFFPVYGPEIAHRRHLHVMRLLQARDNLG